LPTHSSHHPAQRMFTYLLLIYSLSVAHGSNVELVVWGRISPGISESFFGILDSEGDMLRNTSWNNIPSRTISTTVKGAVYFTSQSITYEFDPQNGTVTRRFDTPYTIGVLGYSTNQSKLIVASDFDNIIYSFSEGSVNYVPFITLPLGMYLTNGDSWSIFDDEHSLLYYPILLPPNGAMFLGVFDLSLQTLVHAFPFKPPTQVCVNLVLNRLASNSVFCNDFNGALYEMDISTSVITPLPVDMRKFYNSNAAYIMAGAMDDSSNTWYGIVKVVLSYGIVAIDMYTYEIKQLGLLQQYQYSKISVYYTS